jgi:hypothetical protein
MRNTFAGLLLLSFFSVSAQRDSTLLDQAFYSAMNTSYSLDNPALAIYNGKEHMGYPASIQGVGYYNSADWQRGSIVYRDVLYTDLLLKYDLVTDEVIVRHFNTYTSVTLFTPRIKSFLILGEKFQYFPDRGKSFPPAGIYEELKTGAISLYVKRSKLIDENIVAGVLERKFIDKNAYYALKDGVYYAIKKEDSILDLMKDKRSEVKNRLSEAGIKYKRDTETALIVIVGYYNQSTR